MRKGSIAPVCVVYEVYRRRRESEVIALMAGKRRGMRWRRQNVIDNSMGLVVAVVSRAVNGGGSS
jgi:hypothetical protein